MKKIFGRIKNVIKTFANAVKSFFATIQFGRCKAAACAA